ncbi:MAG: hypothetical protein CVV04_10570 [Firmicutes bacterium HGW-Firmicutes-9]|nr:MAG: hypothetical protein CVV04_10570 [Firmicutes bacterium HGW-Firmicutes-9]
MNLLLCGLFCGTARAKVASGKDNRCAGAKRKRAYFERVYSISYFRSCEKLRRRLTQDCQDSEFSA